MTFKSIHEERESLKVKIHTLECIRDAKEKPLEYWLSAANEGLKVIYSEEPYKEDFPDKELLTLQEQVRKTEKLKEEAERLKEDEEMLKKLEEKRKEIEDIREKAQGLITKTLEKYRGKLAVKDAILLKEPAELEDKISHIFDRHFFTSKFFYIQVFILMAVISFAGFGTWQLFSGAQRAGAMVAQMETKVINASNRIDTITAEAKTEIDTLEKRLTETVTNKIPDIEGKVVDNVTGQVEQNAIARIDKVFEKIPAEQRVIAFIKEKVGPDIKKVNIEENVRAAIQNDADKRVRIAFNNTPADQRIQSVLKGIIEPKVKDLNYDAKVEAVVQKDVSYRVEDLFKKTPAEYQVMNVLKNEVESKIDPIDIQNKVGIVIEEDVTGRIRDVFKKITPERRVDTVIDKWVKTITERNEENINKLNLQPLRQKLDHKTEQMQSLENAINNLEQRVQEASKDIRFSVFSIWDFMDWSLKTSLILFYVLLVIAIGFGAFKIIEPIIKRIF